MFLKLQGTILARSSREMYLTVCIVWKYILSRVLVSVRPSNFVYAKNLGEIGWPALVFIWMTLLPAMNASGAGCHGWAPTNSANLYGGDGGVCVCSRMRVHACVRDAFAIYYNNIWPNLIMIIIKIVILYFIQIRHTDDFPSTGTRLVDQLLVVL